MIEGAKTSFFVLPKFEITKYFMMIMQLFHVKMCTKVNIFRMDVKITIIEFLRLLNLQNCIRNHHTEIEIDRTIITIGFDYRVAPLSKRYLTLSLCLLIF